MIATERHQQPHPPRAVAGVYAAMALTQAQRQRLLDLACGRPVCFGPDDEAAFQACDVAFGPVPPRWIERSTRLRWLQLHSTGVDEYRRLDWRELGARVTVTNLGGFFADPVAQTALAGVMALYRGLDRLVRLQGAHRWDKSAVRGTLRSLRGARVVIVGHGAIGRRFAELLAPFECGVYAWTRPGAGDRPQAIGELDAALTRADIVFVALPETDSTLGLFDAQRLARMKPGAIFVNVGRGSVVDEAALVDRLRSGGLGGAVLDVTADEPLPVGHALWPLPNVILTQHTAGGTTDEQDLKIEFFAENLARYRRGEPLRSIVDWSRGR